MIEVRLSCCYLGRKAAHRAGPSAPNKQALASHPPTRTHPAAQQTVPTGLTPKCIAPHVDSTQQDDALGESPCLCLAAFAVTPAFAATPTYAAALCAELLRCICVVYLLS